MKKLRVRRIGIFKARLVSAIIIKAILLTLSMTGCAPAEYDIEAEANPEEAGEVSGAGTYQENEEVTLKAEPEEGYKFDYWELDGEEVSTEQEYTFNAEEDHLVTAHFSEAKYKVKAEIDPEEAGEVTGTGTYRGKEVAVLKAEAEEYYCFDHWTLEGEKVSTDETYVLNVESDARLTAHFSVDNYEDKLTFLLDKAEEALKEEKLEEAGKHLAEAKELPGAEEAFYQFFEGPRSIEHALSILQEGKVVTGEEISEDLEEIDELAPREPEVKVLEQKPEELYEWFAALREWQVNVQTIPTYLYRNKLIHENGIKKIHSRSEQYLEMPLEMMISEWEVNDTRFYFTGHGSPGVGLSVTDHHFYSKETRLIDAGYKEQKVFITLEIKGAIETSAIDIEPGEQWQLIYDIYKKEDGTFRVGDYAMKDLQKDEVVIRRETSRVDALGPHVYNQDD